MINLADDAMTIKLDYELPEYPKFEEGYRRAPRRESHLTEADKALAIKNALRYIHPDHHEQMAKEFAAELEEHGRIYGYRFRPEGKLYGKPIDEYKGKCIEGRAIQVMIDNNLDFDVALYPYELVTYGETGQVCQNWMQYRLIKKYLEELTDEQTLVVMSGHPLGLFHSHKMAPRVIISNGLMVGTFDDQENFNRAAALGVANYGQMTAGGWMYIGPQGIVHGTFNTLLNAGRMKLGIPQNGDLRGHLFISSGLGGMSGAQPKAAEMSGAASIIAEVDMSRIETRHRQGWVGHVTDSIPEAFSLAHEAMDGKKPISIAYHGNIVASYKKKGSSEWSSSPLNLAQYYVKDNVMYVQLNIAQILATVEANRSKAEMPGFDLSLIKYLAQYLSKGIPLDYSVTGGNARITANKELLMQLLPVLANEKIQQLLLPKLSEIIPNEIKPVLLPVVQELFTNLPEILEKTEDISVTLNLLEK